MNEYELKNINHSFDLLNGKIGCTIRKGDKWKMVNPGDILHLWNCPQAHNGSCKKANLNCEYCGTGLVLGYWYGPIRELPESLLKIEHNFTAQNLPILIEMFKTAYGEINDDDMYLSLIYMRLSGNEGIKEEIEFDKDVLAKLGELSLITGKNVEDIVTQILIKNIEKLENE